jgi:hypothetical protein
MRDEIMGEHVEKRSDMLTRRESDLEFQIIVSRPFQKTMEKLRDQQLKRNIYNCIGKLAEGFQEWKSMSTKKIEVGDPSRSVRSARVNDQMRILFRAQSKRLGSNNSFCSFTMSATTMSTFE